MEAFRETISPRLSMGETMMLGLRLVGEGVPRQRFQDLHGVNLAQVFPEELAQLAAWQHDRDWGRRASASPSGG